MNERKSEGARDPALPASSFKAYAALLESLVEDNLKHEEAAPAIFDNTSRHCLRIARALYSAGEPLEECKRWLDRSADFYLRFIEGKKQHFVGIGSLEERYLERFPAMDLVRRAPDVVRAFRRCTFDEPIAPWEKCLLDSLCAVLMGEPVVVEPSPLEDLRKHAKYWVCLPRLFQAVAERDHASFAEALEEYLVKTRGPGADKDAKAARKAANPEYAGRWCFLAAAMCRIMGEVPNLSKKAREYIPVELITP